MRRSVLKICCIITLICLSLTAAGCQRPSAAADTSSVAGTSSGKEPVTILIAAAASLKNVFDEKLTPSFEKQYPYIHVEATYDSSGKLKTQIEEGLEADLFLSAARTQITQLKDSNLIDGSTVCDLLENEIVLIVPAGSDLPIHSFEDLSLASSIAVGDPESVPAGEYAEEVLQSLKLWDQLKDKFSLGTNVTEVLNWVSEGAADAGIVYKTDAASTDKVTIVSSAPEGSLKAKVIYPAAVVSSSSHKEEAGLFLDFLKTKAAGEIFTGYGFTAVNPNAGP